MGNMLPNRRRLKEELIREIKELIRDSNTPTKDRDVVWITEK